jgi:hypothetical protein
MRRFSQNRRNRAFSSARDNISSFFRMDRS